MWWFMLYLRRIKRFFLGPPERTLIIEFYDLKNKEFDFLPTRVL